MNIKIVEWNDKYSNDYKDLAFEWLNKYVEVEDDDLKTLEHPHERVLDRDGMIWFAIDGDKAVGTITLLKEEDGTWELAKLAVTEKYKGLGISNLLMDTFMDYVKSKGIHRIVLFTNSKLTSAQYVYKKYGFKRIDLGKSKFYTADIKMELTI